MFIQNFKNINNKDGVKLSIRIKPSTSNTVERSANHYTTRALLISLELFYQYKITLKSDVLTQHPINLFFQQV